MPDLQAVIYARVSTEMQATEGGGLEDQVRSCLDLCERQGWAVGAIFRDEGISGATEDRPAFQQALGAVPAGGVLVVDRYDRLSRDARYRLQLAEELSARGVAIISPHGEVDVESAAGFLVYGVDSVVSEHYRRLIGERTATAFARHRRAGRQHGGPAPYGYARNGEGELQPDPERVPVVRMMFGWAMEGHGYAAIAGRLNKQGIRRPDGGTGWNYISVRDLLRNPVYAGRVRHAFRQVRRPGKSVWRKLPRDQWEIHEGRHEAIIEPEEWERVQSILYARAFRAPTNYGHEFLLSGLLKCPNCGGSMSGSHQKSHGRRYPTYRCARYILTRTCKSTVRGAEKWERAFLDLLEAILAGERVLGEVWRYGTSDRRPDLDRVDAELASVAARREALYEALETRRIPVDVLQARLERLGARDQELRGMRAGLEAEAPLRTPPARLSGLREVLTASEIPLAQRRAILREVVERVGWKDGKLEITFCPAP